MSLMKTSTSCRPAFRSAASSAVTSVLTNRRCESSSTSRQARALHCARRTSSSVKGTDISVTRASSSSLSENAARMWSGFGLPVCV